MAEKGGIIPVRLDGTMAEKEGVSAFEVPGATAHDPVCLAYFTRPCSV